MKPDLSEAIWLLSFFSGSSSRRTSFLTTLRILNRKPLEAGAGNQYNGHQGKDDEFDDFIKKRLCS
ncbi:hypothetical protein HOLDEFILI_04214 [Holdemania filiformis DSM 12042]|uniref:Uncharacterized protein n=1 Tax=Holdemania filiformis DSM 12042 TaxID=545696 RepID=B9YEE0_9FIRM|nr:hypothetical protein HOLDEFILI_04214 [Holdemania filiformis DSM 12042]